MAENVREKEGRMREIGGFSVHPVTAENLSELFRRESALEEARVCELADCARRAAGYVGELLDGGMDLAEALSLLSDGLVFPAGVPDGAALPECEPLLRVHGGMLSRLDRLAFCRLFCREAVGAGCFRSVGDFFAEGLVPETFVYVRNVFADEAYDVFSGEFSRPTVHYAASLREAVGEVADGVTSYALLPLEERGGVRIPTVEEFLLQNELHITGITPVFGLDGRADLKYAMVSKNFRVPVAEADDDLYFEFLVGKDSEPQLSEILSAAEGAGAEVYRVHTLHLVSSEGESSYFSVIVKKSAGDFLVLWLYLFLFAPAFIPIGMYKNLE